VHTHTLRRNAQANLAQYGYTHLVLDEVRRINTRTPHTCKQR
jgi:hypothetical protein